MLEINPLSISKGSFTPLLQLKKFLDIPVSTQEEPERPAHIQSNHNGVITHLEPDILECEVKWALESITMNKAIGGYGIPVELFQILKDNAMKDHLSYQGSPYSCPKAEY